MQQIDAGAPEVTELESWLDAQCPCEVPHHSSTCTRVVYGVLHDANHPEFWGLKACTGVVAYRAEVLADHPRIKCSICWGLAKDCWRIIPI